MSEELVVPTTGELVLRDDPAQCARVLFEIRELEGRLRELKTALRDALVDHSRQQGTKTIHFPEMIAQINTPSTIIWDYEILCELHEAGLPEERFNELVMEEVTYKVNGSVANSIAGSSEVYAEIIERAKSTIKKEASITLKSTKGG